MQLELGTIRASEASRQRGRRNLVIGAAMLAVGIAVTAWTWGGEVQVVAYGAVLAGFSALFIGATQLWPTSADTGFRYAAMAAAAIVLVILGLIAITMTGRAQLVLNRMGIEFFTSKRWSPADEIFGALPFVFGTLYTAAIAVALAVPVSLLVALFITQVAPRWLKKPLIYLVDLLAVVPSVVYGLWGVLVLSEHGGLGRSFATAGIILAVMIIPIITSLSREVIETTPAAEKEAALALGATRWEMIRAAVLPHSKGGLVGAVMLGLGRAMGETIAAALVIGSALGQITLNAFAPGNSMPAVIANEWGEADDLHKSALIALAVLLFVITIIVNLAATAIVSRSMRRSRGHA